MKNEEHLEIATGPELLDDWRNGDQQAAEAIFERYQSRLVQIVASKLNHKLRSRLDPEDVFMSTMRSVFRSTAEEDFGFRDETGFWKWLVSVTLNKTYNRIEREFSEIRTPKKESSDPSFGDPELEEPTPAAEAAFDDLLENILKQVNNEHKRILLAKLDGFTHAEIASHLRASTKTVQRSGAAIRDAAVAVLGEELPDWLKLAENLSELLDEPVIDWLPEISVDRNNLAAPTLREVLHSPNTDLRTLDGIRSVAKQKSNQPYNDIPTQVVAAIYLLAISAARVQHNVNISQDNEEILKKRVNSILQGSWMDGKTRDLLERFVDSTSKMSLFVFSIV